MLSSRRCPHNRPYLALICRFVEFRLQVQTRQDFAAWNPRFQEACLLSAHGWRQFRELPLGGQAGRGSCPPQCPPPMPPPQAFGGGSLAWYIRRRADPGAFMGALVQETVNRARPRRDSGRSYSPSSWYQGAFWRISARYLITEINFLTGRLGAIQDDVNVQFSATYGHNCSDSEFCRLPDCVRTLPES